MSETESANTDYGFTRDRDDSRVVQEYLNPLPRSVVRPGESELLDGEWRFDLDREDRGLSERWYLGHDYTRTAVWPGSVEAHLALPIYSDRRE